MVKIFPSKIGAFDTLKDKFLVLFSGYFGHNCWINFCHFFDIVNLVIFHPDYIDRGYLL